MAGTVIVDTINSSVAGTPPVFQANGTQIGTLCRAWVNFNGTGTVAIRGSFNVSSVTDLGTGNYQVNFTTAMPDTNYATNYNLAESYGSGNYSYMGTVNNTTGYVQMYGRTGGTGAATDMANCMVSIFR